MLLVHICILHKIPFTVSCIVTVQHRLFVSSTCVLAMLAYPHCILEGWNAVTGFATWKKQQDLCQLLGVGMDVFLSFEEFSLEEEFPREQKVSLPFGKSVDFESVLIFSLTKSIVKCERRKELKV